ncbi:unnamed protein product [Darwinula stevensoni]|uniref:BTB domain-containing protein n=1 Tax=Darwinula stevensoni TaxID=69355 RepID=A0A7R9AEY5_9CRUS|nr:unnamed protein product [Darwinula stevensoni]CAG0902781.1 unnamed protein product [Darwinula stevensoni]
MASAAPRKKTIVIEKDLDDHIGLAKDISASFKTGPSWCDVIILVQGTKFYSCKGILASVSPYFRQLFTTDFKDVSEREIRLEGSSKVGFNSVWDYIHGTQVAVEGEEEAIATLLDAHFLGMKRFCKRISTTMKTFMDSENAFRILKIAEEYGYQDLREAAVEFISGSFSKVVGTSEFISISFETLSSFLNRDDLGVSSEKEVYDAARKWLHHDSSRKRHLPDLLDKIRLPLLPYEYLKSVLLKDPIMYGDARCLGAITDARDYHVPELRHTVPKEKTRHRTTLDSIWSMNFDGKIYRMNPHNWELDEITDYPLSVYYAFAGIDRKMYVTEEGHMKMFDLEKREWKEGPKPPEYLKCAATAVSSGSIFICGGSNQKNKVQKSVFRFSGEWIRLSDMKYERSSLGACYEDSCLHVIGGMPNSDKHERLDLRTSRRTGSPPGRKIQPCRLTSPRSPSLGWGISK